VTDSSPFIPKVRQANPDVVCLNLAGNQVTNFVKQYAEFGLPYPTVGFDLNTADAWAAGIGNLSGAWPTVWFHTLDTLGSQAFVKAFQAKYVKIPENHAWIEHVALKIAAKAMAETGSAETDGLVEHLESGAEFDIMEARPAYFRADDHHLIQEAYPFSVKAEGSYDDVHDMMELVLPSPARTSRWSRSTPRRTPARSEQVVIRS
jgi:branched-chain amino acid transport system substrate-binding protein